MFKITHKKKPWDESLRLSVGKPLPECPVKGTFFRIEREKTYYLITEVGTNGEWLVYYMHPGLSNTYMPLDSWKSAIGDVYLPLRHSDIDKLPKELVTLYQNLMS